MANLLTPEYKKGLRKRDMFKVAYVYLVGLGVIFLLASVFLVPSFLLAGSKRLTAKENLGLLSASISSKESEEFGRLLSEANAKIEILDPGQAGSPIHETVAQIVSAKPAGVSIRAFEFSNRGVEKSAKIRGFSERRSDLLSFSSALESIEGVSGVELPIATLARDREIDFDISITFDTDAKQ